MSDENKAETASSPAQISEVERLFNDSRLSQARNGSINLNGEGDIKPTSGQKWWASILLGVLFAIVSSPILYSGTNYIIVMLGGMAIYQGVGPNVAGLLIHTLLFIVIVRILLW